MWGEQILTIESMNRMTFPRIAAYAEIGWVSPARKKLHGIPSSINETGKIQ